MGIVPAYGHQSSLLVGYSGEGAMEELQEAKKNSEPLGRAASGMACYPQEGGVGFMVDGWLSIDDTSVSQMKQI